MKKVFLKKLVTLFMTVLLVITLFPVSLSADDDLPTDEQNTQEAGENAAADNDLPSSDEEDPASEEQETVAKENIAFEESVTVDDVIVSVKAEDGAFPNGVTLSVEKVINKEVDAAVDEARPDGTNTALSYTFDIKVLDSNNEEVQPADGKKVELSFALAPAGDENLEPAVYHVTETENEEEFKAEPIDPVNTEEDTVTIEADRFSFYTVEFVYRDKQYTLNGDKTVSLSKILEAVGLSGEVTYVSVSDDALFSVSKENDEWILTSHKAFSSEEWMKVTINGIKYKITVTDEETPLSIADYWNEENSCYELISGTYILTDDFTAEGYVCIPEGETVTIDLNGHELKRVLSNAVNKGYIIENNGTLTVKDSSGSSAGKITGGKNGNGSQVGAGVYNTGTFTLESGTITDNKASHYGAGVYNAGTFNFKGGVIKDNTATYNGGGIFNDNNCTVNMTDGRITGNYAPTGGGINNYGTMNISGGTIISNTASGKGGGIYNGADGTLKISGNPQITGNTSYTIGGGVYNSGTLSLSGKPIIHGNQKGTDTKTDSNLALNEGAVFVLESKFETGARIGLTAEPAYRIISSGYTDTGSLSGDLSKFFTADAGYEIEYRDKEIYIKLEATKVSSWKALQKAINDASDNTLTTIALAENITASSDDDRIQIPKSKQIALDLAGYTLNRNRTSSHKDGHVIEVFGKLTILDSSVKETGWITGGYAEKGGGININKSGECELKSGTIGKNKASEYGGGVYVHGIFKMSGGSVNGNEIANSGKDGGGIYVDGDDKATLAITGGSLKSNTTVNDKYEGGHGGGVFIESGATASIKNATFNDNWSRKKGAAIYTEVDVDIDNCTFEWNHTVAIKSQKEEYDQINHYYYIRLDDTYDGGAIYIDDSDVNISNSKFKGNYIENYALQYNHGNGGAIYINEGTLNISDSSFENNKSWEGGAIYGDSGTKVIVERTTFSGNNLGITRKYSDDQAPQKIPVSSKGGGAIANYGDLTLNDCTFTGNYLTAETEEAKGGAVYSKGGSLSVDNSTFTGNKGRYGAAIYLADGTVTLKDSDISNNIADSNGGGVYVGTNKQFTVKGLILIRDNSASAGNDVYLQSGKYITFVEALTNGSDIGVGLEKKEGRFTTNFTKYHSIPEEFFYSNDGFDVILKDKEGYIQKGTLDDSGDFIRWQDQINYNPNRLSGSNWMSGISGDRYLNEINIPGTHDTSMNNVSSKGCLAGDIGKMQAKTQREYLVEQLEHGARFFDIRMKTQYCADDLLVGLVTPFAIFPALCIPVIGGFVAGAVAVASGILLINGSKAPIYKDDGVNLWACHGRSLAGTFYALNEHDDNLSVSEELEIMKEFLTTHPTETIIIDARPETDASDGETYYGPLNRLKTILEEFSKEKNPVTGESYVYWEDGVVGKKCTRWPQLKECRGKILIYAGKGEAVADTVGGLYYNIDGIKMEKAGGSYKDGTDRAKNVREFLKDKEDEKIPRNVMGGQMKKYFWVQLNTTDTMFIYTPVQLAEQYVLPEVIGQNGMVNETKRGTYFGWFSMDAPRANHHHDIWITNFPTDLEYVTVTVKSGLSGSDAPADQVYKLLKGTQITIPGCIYEGAQADKFHGWMANVDSKIYNLNDNYQVTEDITFTAQWASTVQTPVTVVWNDASNLDDKRPATLNITYDGNNKTISSEDNWTTILSGALSSDPIVGAVEGYTSSIKGEQGKDGYTITMTHNPDVSVFAKGTITWDDQENKDGIRPESVTLHLYADGTEIKQATVSASDSWAFDLGTYPRYKDAELITYMLVEEEIKVNTQRFVAGYTNYVEAVEGDKKAINSFKVHNLHEVTMTLMYARIEWDDDNDAAGARPESVAVQWLKGGQPFGDLITVEPSEEQDWTVGLELTYAEMYEVSGKMNEIAQKYEAKELTDEEFLKELENSVTYGIRLQNPIANYVTTVQVKTDEETGSTYYQILNTYKSDAHDLTFYEDTEGTVAWKKISLAEGSSLEQYADYGSAEPNILKKDGSTLAGWATEPGIVVHSYYDQDGQLNPKLEGKLVDWDSSISEDMNVYPIWIADRIYVKILPDAKDVVIDEAQSLEFTANIDEKIAMRYLVYAAREGYTLDGWYTQSGVLWNGENWKSLEYVSEGWDETAGWGVTPEYCDKDEKGDPIISYNDDRKFVYRTITLTARWSPKTVTVKYELGTHHAEGQTAPENGQVTLGNSITLAQAPSAHSDYIFTGWKAPDGKLYSAGGSFLFDDWKAQGELDEENPTITMTAQYEEKAKVTLTFDSAGGTAIEPLTEHEGNTVDLREARFTTTRTGYSFDGWYNSNNEKCEGVYAFTENETLTAHWTVNQYTITFDSAGGNEVKTITQDYDTAITVPKNPAKEHYTFMGWSPELPKKMPAKNMTVKAVWKPITYTISFDTDGGSEIAQIEDIYGAPVTAPEDPTKGDYIFKGWMDKNSTLVTLPSYMPDNNPTYKAKWEKLPPEHTHVLTPVEAKNATCTEDGNEAYWTCEECGKYFSDAEGMKEVTKNSLILPALGHDWTEPIYEWSKLTVTAKRECGRDHSHDQTETADIIVEVTKQATPTEKGVKISTATFKNPAFEKQTKTEEFEFEGYEVSFNTNGGQPASIKAQTVTMDTQMKLTKPDDPRKGTYDFEGWYIDDGTFSTEWNFNDEVTGNTKLIARYGFTVAFLDADKVIASATVYEDKDGKLDEPGIKPTKEGYTFDYWGKPDTKPFGFDKEEAYPGLNLRANYFRYAYEGSRNTWMLGNVGTSNFRFVRWQYQVKDYESDKDLKADFETNEKKAYVDGTLLSEDVYTYENGSLIVKLKDSYLNTLSVGDHTLKVEFTDGEAETVFTIIKKTEPVTPSYTPPKTGDR